MSNNLTKVLAAGLLIFIFVISVLTIRNDSLTMDELAHLPAGYSYLTQRDMRLNPEHPPLIKDLSALPLLFIKDINFPSEIKAWQEDVNGQWKFGSSFLFKSNNPAEEMIFWGRIPMILILVLLGFYVFIWTRELFGNTASLIALSLFSFSPTLLAHGRLVTTDVGAAAGVFIATYYFIKFLKKTSSVSLKQAWQTGKKSLLLAGIALGLAQLAKFSLILLLPFFGIIVVIWAMAKSPNFKEFLKVFARYFALCILIGLITLTVIWLVYQYHVWDYPPERQLSDTEFTLTSFNQDAAKVVVWMSDKPILRPMGQYLLGLFMILQRASGGNTGFFFGEISAAGWKSYFPTVYLIKEPLTFHILTIISILCLIWLVQKSLRKNSLKTTFNNWVKYHFVEIASLIFIAIYWIVSLRSNLNIGVRHLLPVFPFTILLISGMISFYLRPPFPKAKKAFLAVLILWQIYSVITIYPSFLAYFNESIGKGQGHEYTVDSNLDWGQDLKRLNQWLDKNNIDQVYINYFGGSDINYYLKGKNLPWWGDRNPAELPKGSYLAVSATLLQGGKGKPSPSYNEPTGYYNWLNQYEPVAVIGYSIFVYHIE